MAGTLTRVLLVLAIAGQVAWAKSTTDAWFGPDKVAHFGLSSLIGASATSLARQSGQPDCQAPWLGLSVVVLIGGAKETTDLLWRKKIWSYKDMLWNIAGGLAGSFLVSSC